MDEERCGRAGVWRRLALSQNASEATPTHGVQWLSAPHRTGGLLYDISEIAARINSDCGSDSWYFGKLQTTKDGVISYQLGQHANIFIGGST